MKKTAGSQMKCMECGHTFRKRLGPKTYDVKCPKCRSVDVEPVNEMFVNRLERFLNEATEPDVRNIEFETIDNPYFRKVLFTGKHMQLVLMSIEPLGEIGEEVHQDVDQFFRIESGVGELVVDGGLDTYPLEDGISLVVPAGTTHNIRNTSDTEALKLYSIYSPPNHPKDTLHVTKEEADMEEE